MSQEFLYQWPNFQLNSDNGWYENKNDNYHERNLPETTNQLTANSRWPAFFPSPICLITTTDGVEVGFEKIVGPSIVNRFPYVAAISLCRQTLSKRHHARGHFTKILENGGSVAIQFLAQGEELKRAINIIAETPEERTSERITLAKLDICKGQTVAAPVLKKAYLVYEGKLVRATKDESGNAIYDRAWTDVGSHRIYFIEITAIQLRKDIANGESQIHWKSLPNWSADPSFTSASGVTPASGLNKVYQKGYNPNYKFPSKSTVKFEFNSIKNGMAIKYLPPLPQDQIEVDNEKARWPCFFPSPTGLITAWTKDKKANLMPCGSTTITSRHPLIIAPCISYSSINERYAPRASLEIIKTAGYFGCGVAYINDEITEAIRYCGTTSFVKDPDKIINSGLHISNRPLAPRLDDLPIHFECKLTGEIRMGTHIMLLGEVKSILVRNDLTIQNPISWCPWPDLKKRVL